MDYGSASEGEIVESRAEQKATTTRTRAIDNKIDGNDRPRQRASGSERPLHSDDHDYDSRSHASLSNKDFSPDRRHHAPQGVKRRHPDDPSPSEYSDPRKFRVHYEEGRSKPGRGDRRSDHRDNRASNARHSTQSHSAYGYHNGTKNGWSRDGPPSPIDRRSNIDAFRGTDRQLPRISDSATEQTTFGESSPNRPGRPALSSSTNAAVSKEHAGIGENEMSEDAESDTSHIVNEAAVIEQRRKRREMLRAKHNREKPLLQQALHASAVADPATTPLDSLQQVASTAASPSSTSPSTPPESLPMSPLTISVVDDAELANDAAQGAATHAHSDEPSAADYDPSMDMQEDRYADRKVLEAAKSENSNGHTLMDKKDESDEFDMFADDVNDDSPENAIVPKQDDGIQAVLTGKQLDKSLLDDWDDPEGYYRIILGEILDKRYQIQTNLGKGVFSAVVRALDNRTGHLVAIKVIRKQESMYKAGLKEIHTLEKLSEADPEDKKHIIRLKRHFMHKGHLCVVFEHLSINLREVLKKFGRDVGINIRAVRAYAQQIFMGLSLLKRCDILHADLKPDNILVNENRSQLKIADLGAAFDVQDSEVTDMLVSRFYRAPEIMLGIKGDFALDMWSIGCTLFELYTGRICFTGPTNNQMLKGILECRGKFPNRVLKRAEFWAQHFDADGTFLSQEYDNITRKEVTRRMNIVRPVPVKELKARLLASSGNLSVADAKEVGLFADLLDKCLALDPLRRITPTEALRHGFINRSMVATTGAAKAK